MLAPNEHILFVLDMLQSLARICQSTGASFVLFAYLKLKYLGEVKYLGTEGYLISLLLRR